MSRVICPLYSSLLCLSFCSYPSNECCWYEGFWAQFELIAVEEMVTTVMPSELTTESLLEKKLVQDLSACGFCGRQKHTHNPLTFCLKVKSF